MKGYGLADREAGVANGPETLYEVASLSKQFTAAAVLSLEQDGGLAVDSPLSSYLTSIPDAYRGVTIYQALTHTGGLPRGGSGRGLDLTAAAMAITAMKSERVVNGAPIGSGTLEISYSKSSRFRLFAKSREFGAARFRGQKGKTMRIQLTYEAQVYEWNQRSRAWG